MARPTVIDLFSGAGGFALGFHAAGSRVLAAVDFDEAAGATFRARFGELQPEAPPRVFAGDEGNIEDLDLSRVSSVAPDLVVGGPPCQGFSRVGRGKLNDLSEEGHAADARNGLYKRFLAAVELWKPRGVVMENVAGMLSVDGRSVADEVARDLIELGYTVGYGLLNAVWYGVPQYRERLFFVGFRRDLGLHPSLPPATHFADLPSGYFNARQAQDLFLPFADLHCELEVDVRHVSVPATTVGEALGDLPLTTDHLDGVPLRGNFRRALPYRGRATSAYARLMRRWPGMSSPRKVDDQVVRRTPRDYETFRRMKPGDRYSEALQIARARFAEKLATLGADAPAPETPEYRELEKSCVPPYPEHMFKDKWRKLRTDQPSWTVPAHLSKDTYSHIHYDDAQARSISVREAARLQSFPDGFRFEGNMGDCFRQIGNAVPPLLSWAVAAHVLRVLDFPTTPAPVPGRAPRGDRSARG